jgi:hypothetical protein
MLSEKTWKAIHRIYELLQSAGSAIACAIVLYLFIFVMPHMSEIRADFESQRILQISAETRHYCEKWGMHKGTQNYLQCTLDLQQIRGNAEKRVLSDIF